MVYAENMLEKRTVIGFARSICNPLFVRFGSNSRRNLAFATLAVP